MLENLYGDNNKNDKENICSLQMFVGSYSECTEFEALPNVRGRILFLQ